MPGEGKRGAFRLLPAPPGVIFLREEGAGAAERTVRLAGEIGAAGAIADVVGLVAQAGWTGELVVLDGASARSLFFEAGSVLGAQTNVPAERIGSLLVRLGALDERQVQAVVAAMGRAARGRRFGDVAVELGLVARERLFQSIAVQTKEIAFAMLQVAGGAFFFFDRFDPERVASAHRLGASSLLMESLQRMDEVSYFRERIPSDDHRPVPVRGRGEPQAELRPVWAACDGQRSVREVGRACGLPEFEVMRALVQLLQAGFVRVLAPPQGALALLEAFNAALAAIYRFAERAHVVPLLREHLAGFTASIAIYEHLFAGAGPDARGRFDPERVTANSRALGQAAGGAAGSDAALAERLYPYVAFALFATSSLLSKEDERALNEEVAPFTRILAPSLESG